MIKIKRTPTPEILMKCSAKGTRYNKKDVVESLWKMQHEKCCYCEQMIPLEGHLKAVEHFRPKSAFRKLKNAWKNLLLACAQCNGKKSNKFPVQLSDNPDETKVVYVKKETVATPSLIDPSNPTIDPEDHLDFVFDEVYNDLGRIIAKNDSSLGHKTIGVIGLDNKFYTNKRKTYYLNTLMAEYRNLLMANHKQIVGELEHCKRSFRIYMSAKGEFAGFVRAFGRHKRLDSKFGIEIPVGAEV